MLNNSSQWKTVLALLLITGACVLAYANMMNNDFVWDDVVFIKKSYFIRDFSNIRDVFKVDFWQASYRSYSAKFYRPFIIASFIIDYAIWGMNQFGFHLANLLMHIGVTIAVWRLARFFINRTASLAAAVLFAVHPIHTESVTFICGRTDVMAALFMFWSVAAYLKSVQGKRIVFVCASAVLYAGALLCKEASVIAVPLIAVLYYGKHRPGIQRIKKIVPDIIPFFVVTVLYVVLRHWVLSGPVKLAHASPGGTLLGTMLTMPFIILTYIGKLLVPVRMSIDYAPEVVESVLSPVFWCPMVVLTVLFCGGVGLLYKRGGLAGASILLFFIGIAPVTNIISTGVFMADRFLYISSAGFCFLAGTLVQGGFVSMKIPQVKKYCIVCMALIAVLMTILTIRRNSDWRTEERLWLKTAQTTPASFRAHGSIAQMLLDQGRYELALKEARIANMLRPQDYRVLGNLAVIHMKMGDYTKAVEYFQRALEYEPRDFRTYANLHLLHDALDEPERALDAVNTAIHYNQRQKDLYYMKAEFLARQDKPEEAVKAYNDCLRLYPDDIQSLESAGDILMERLNNSTQAARYYQKALEIDHGNARIGHKLKKAIAHREQ
ncbi:MAG: tetratricopeptide repeat protein [Candidatus Auribacterota bacterium]